MARMADVYVKIRIGKYDSDIGEALKDITDGQRAQFIKAAIREKFGIATVSTRLDQILDEAQQTHKELERLTKLLAEHNPIDING